MKNNENYLLLPITTYSSFSQGIFIDWKGTQKYLLDGYNNTDCVNKEDEKSFLFHIIQNEIEVEMDFDEFSQAESRKKKTTAYLKLHNQLPSMASSRWRKNAFPPREYTPLSQYYISPSEYSSSSSPSSSSSSPSTFSSYLGVSSLREQLNTNLSGFLGPAYNYDDCGLTETWMLNFRDASCKAPSSEEIIATQVESVLDSMCGTVQDRVCNELQVLNKVPLNLSTPLRIQEVPVWGIDAFTRRMIELSIQNFSQKGQEIHTDLITFFIEKRLLPAINTQKEAYLLSNALDFLLRADRNESSSFVLECAKATLLGIDRYGAEYFKVHPKGTGVICCCKEGTLNFFKFIIFKLNYSMCIECIGIPAHVFVTEYLGEIYPPYRWYAL